MKKIILYTFFAFSLFIFSSCERAIDFDLGNSEPQLVVDAFLNNLNEEQTIKLSYTQPYLSKGGATSYDVDSIWVIDSVNRKFYPFTKKTAGVYHYIPNNDTFLQGGQFLLVIFDKGERYVSFSKMGRVPKIDSIISKEERFGGQISLQAEFFAKDPVGMDDLVWVKSYKNDTLRTGNITVAYDNSFSRSEEGDGETYIPPIRNSGGYTRGDKATFELYSLTPECFFYLKQIEVQLNNTAGLFAQPVANVNGNVINFNNPKKKILGFFNVGSATRASVIVNP